MCTNDSLYNELKPEINSFSNVLFELSETALRKRNGFLPHAVVLTDEGEVKMFMALPEQSEDKSSSNNGLSLLHDGLRQQSQENSLKAIGVAEDVTVAIEEQYSGKAIKVLFEHKRGLNIALYLPYEKKLLRGYVMGTIFVLPVTPEVNAWTDGNSR
jgi:hypothetical protein